MSNMEVLNSEKSLRNSNGRVNVNNVERAISILGGGTIMLLGMKRHSWTGLLLTVGGSALLHRGVTGHCMAKSALANLNGSSASTGDSEEIARDIHVEKSITINRNADELYSFWREFENLPQIMPHLESVTSIGPGRSHWVISGVAGKRFEWDAEIYNEKPNELIAWRSLPGSEVVNAGSVRFEAGPPGRGTRVTVVANYNVVGGKLAALLAKLFNGEPGQMIEDDLRRFKQLMETGEIPTVHGQPSGRTPQQPTADRKASKKALGRVSADTGEHGTQTHVA